MSRVANVLKYRNRIFSPESGNGTTKRSVFLCITLLLGVAVAGKREGLDFYNRGQYAQALNELKGAALGNDGDPEAQALMGTIFLKGLGTEKDAIQAAYWFQEAATKGNAAGQRNLGEIYLAGNGLPQDDYQANYWTQQAAIQGDAIAQVTLGKLLLDGRGAKRNAQTAVRWFQQAADQGNADAQYQLAQLYERGEGTTQDQQQALRLYRTAAAAGQKAAAEALQRLTSIGTLVPKTQASSPPILVTPQGKPSVQTVQRKRVALLLADQSYQQCQ